MQKWILRGAFLLFIGALFAAVHFLAPPQHVPWKPVSLDRPIGWATGAQLDRLSHTPDYCRAALGKAGVEFADLEVEATNENCSLAGAINLERSVTPYNAPVRTTCPLAAALYVWERDVLHPAAEKYLGHEVSRIETYGTFSCRRMYNRASAPWSEHATANAIDIAGVTLADGSRVMVKQDWRADSPEGEFLKEIFEGGCRVFRVGLGPDYNAAHADHFHFDMGGGMTCR